MEAYEGTEQEMEVGQFTAAAALEGDRKKGRGVQSTFCKKGKKKERFFPLKQSVN